MKEKSGAEIGDSLSVEEASNAQEDGREERLAHKAFLLHLVDSWTIRY